MSKTLQEWLDLYPFAEDYFSNLDLDLSDKKHMTYEEALKTFSREELEEAAVDPSTEPENFYTYLDEMAEFLGWSRGKLLSSLTILPGTDKSGEPENFDSLTLYPSEIVSVVGPTGSGKSRLLQDIEWVAQGDTPTGRKIYIDGKVPDSSWRTSPHKKLVAQLSQNMNFVMDLSVREFLELHGAVRMVPDREELTEQLLESANKLAGEEFSPDSPLTGLSGGQSRALMIADTAGLSASPVILLDEIENAGIDRKAALDLLIAADKILFIATHDPILALMADKRIVINNGGIVKIIKTSKEEKLLLEELTRYDDVLRNYRNELRFGKNLSRQSLNNL